MSRIDREPQRDKHIPGRERHPGPVREPGQRRIGVRVSEKFDPNDNDFDWLIQRIFGGDDINFRMLHGFPAGTTFRRGDLAHRSQDNSGISWRDRDLKIIKDIGATTPDTYSAHDMINTPHSMIAKVPNAQRGDGKYLLRTREEKLRIAAFFLLNDEAMINLALNPDQAEAKKQLDQICEKIAKGETEGPEFDSASNRKLTFEKFIDTPGNRYTSFRIVVDAFGEIHSILLMYSATDKADTQNTVREKSSPDDLAGIYDSYLLSPSSPFFIASPPFVSNHAKGGGQINFLYPEAVDEPTRELQRSILEDHRFDPDNPQLPDELIELARKAGMAFKKESFYTGVDFIMDKHGKFYLLELNIMPHIDPEDIGIPDGLHTTTAMLLRIYLEALRRRDGRN